MSDPIPVLLWCPGCGARHVDAGEFAAKPHHTHACQVCGMVWRPAIGPTVGVQFLPGFADKSPVETGDALAGLMERAADALAQDRGTSLAGPLELGLLRCLAMLRDNRHAADVIAPPPTTLASHPGAHTETCTFNNGGAYRDANCAECRREDAAYSVETLARKTNAPQ